jgi:hypothetical protein
MLQDREAVAARGAAGDRLHRRAARGRRDGPWIAGGAGMVRHGLFVAAAASLVSGVTSARADELTLSTQIGTWDAAVAALRADLGSEGRTLRVAVRAGGVRVPCERYLLQLDAAAGSAFRATACDPATQETWLVLARRAALFDEGHDVPRPRTVSITAILRATAVAQGSPQGGALVRCRSRSTSPCPATAPCRRRSRSRRSRSSWTRRRTA